MPTKELPGETDVNYFRNRNRIESGNGKKDSKRDNYKQKERKQKPDDRTRQDKRIRRHEQRKPRPEPETPLIDKSKIIVTENTGKYGLSGPKTVEAYQDVLDTRVQIAMENGKSYPILRDDKQSFNYRRGLKPGDIFNAILMAFAGKEGPQKNYRIFQFENQGHIGYVEIFNQGIYKVSPLKFEELKVGWTYRFEVFRTAEKKGSIFYCKAFKTLYGEDAIETNFVKNKHVDLQKREPFEFFERGQYLVGIDHTDKKDGKLFGVFYDALHPDMTGIVYCHSTEIANQIKLGRWAIVEPFRIRPGKKNRVVIYSNFIRFAK